MSWLRKLLAAFRGSDSGQSLVEYLIVVGTCALVGIAAFTRYGQALKSDLSADAKHIEGDGLPNTGGLLSMLGVDYNEIPGWCVKPNYCFAAGTPVQSEAGDRPIESIRIGDRIWARDIETGAIALRPVVNTYRTARVPVVDLQLSAGLDVREHLRVTRNHLFWVEGRGWVQAQALGASALWSMDARLSANLLELSDEPTTVYNLEVSEFHSYFVGHSHVLVHNGDPTSAACPTTPTPTPTPTPSSSTRPPARPDVGCGESGTYRDGLGGGKRARGGVSRKSPGLQRDHVPSGAAIQARGVRLMKELSAQLEGGKCRELTDKEEKDLDKAIRAAEAAVMRETHDNGFAVAEPTALHMAGRTWGSRNKPLYKGDAGELQRAAYEDRREIERLINSGNYPGALPGSPCAKDILAAFDQAVARTQDDYDAELGAIARAELEKSGYTDILKQTCEGFQ